MPEAEWNKSDSGKHDFSDPASFDVSTSHKWLTARKIIQGLIVCVNFAIVQRAAGETTFVLRNTVLRFLRFQNPADVRED
jgi:hypothetical protein